MQTQNESASYAKVVASQKKARGPQMARPASGARVSSSQASSSKVHTELKKVQRIEINSEQKPNTKGPEEEKITHSNTEILLSFFQELHNTAQPSTQSTLKEDRLRLNCIEGLEVPLPPDVNANAFMTENSHHIANFFHDFNKLDEAGRKNLLTSLFRRLAKHDEEVRKSVTYALLHVDSRVQHERGKLISIMSPCYIAAGMREAIGEFCRILYISFGSISEVQKYFPESSLNNKNERTSIFKIIHESLKYLAGEEGLQNQAEPPFSELEFFESDRDSRLDILHTGLCLDFEDVKSEKKELDENVKESNPKQSNPKQSNPKVKSKLKNFNNDRQCKVLKAVAYCSSFLLRDFESKMKEVDDALNSLNGLVKQEPTEGKSANKPSLPTSYQSCLDNDIVSKAQIESILRETRWDLDGQVAIKGENISKGYLFDAQSEKWMKSMLWFVEHKPAIALILSRCTIRGIFRRICRTYDDLNDDVHLHWELDPSHKSEAIQGVLLAMDVEGKSKQNARDHRRADESLLHNLLLQSAGLRDFSAAAKTRLDYLAIVGKRKTGTNAIGNREIFPIPQDESERQQLGKLKPADAQ